ncbi:unnamed protein product [Acanthosepion pharaonis]|uniref:Uncharacterized protein n=1 Tax=Acanthosepion pharaonis TaxID=158019 RepID=A0A812BFL0_ACAPH|nr:unnamed protein product [Sepia pharaonis]
MSKPHIFSLTFFYSFYLSFLYSLSFLFSFNYFLFIHMSLFFSLFQCCSFSLLILNSSSVSLFTQPPGDIHSFFLNHPFCLSAGFFHYLLVNFIYHCPFLIIIFHSFFSSNVTFLCSLFPDYSHAILYPVLPPAPKYSHSVFVFLNSSYSSFFFIISLFFFSIIHSPNFTQVAVFPRCDSLTCNFFFRTEMMDAHSIRVKENGSFWSDQDKQNS